MIGIWVDLACSPKEYVEHVKHMVGAVVIDQVGIGIDTDLLPLQAGSTNLAWPAMNGGFFNAIAAEIAKFGGGNYCRVFEQATAGHA
jgi:membrane dipeptidase